MSQDSLDSFDYIDTHVNSFTNATTTLVLVLDGKVVQILDVDERVAAIFKSNPTVIDMGLVLKKEEAPYIGDNWEGGTTFTEPAWSPDIK